MQGGSGQSRLVYFECDTAGHEDNLLNMVCLEQECQNRGLICSLCSYYAHKNHLQRPLKVFLNEYKSVLAKVATGEKVKEIVTPVGGLSINIRRSKQIFDGMLQRLRGFSTMISNQIDEIQEQSKEYYEEQVNCLRKAQASQGNNSTAGSDFVNEGKQIVESLERSVPTIVDEQRGLVDLLVRNVVAQQDGQIKWKDEAKAGKGQEEDDEADRNSDNILIAETNLMDLSKTVEGFCMKVETHCKQVLSHIYQARSEVSATSMQNEISDDDTKSNKARAEVKIFGQVKPLEKIVEVKRDLKQDLIESDETDEKGSDDRLKKIQNYLASHQKKPQQQEVNVIHDEEEEQTGDFGKCELIDEQRKQQQTASSSKANEGSNNVTIPPVQRGYAQRLTSLTRLNKPLGVTRQGSDLMEFFSSNEDSNEVKNKLQLQKEEEISKNIVSYRKPLEYFESFTDQQQQQQQQIEQQVSLKLNHTIKAHNSICKDIVVLDNDRVATCSFDSGVKIWDMKSGKLVHEVKGHSKRVMTLAYSSKYSMLISGGEDGLVLGVKDLGGDTWEEVIRLKHETSKKIQSVCFYEEEDSILSGSDDGEVSVWRINDSQKQRNLESCKERLSCIRVISEKKFLIGAASQSLFVWRIGGNGKLVSTKRNIHKEAINDIQLVKLSLGSCFITAGEDRVVKLWSIEDFSVLTEFSEDFSVSSLIFSKSLDAIILSIWGDKPNGYVSFWNVEEQKRVAITNSRRQGVTKITFDETTKTLACGLDNGSLELFRVDRNPTSGINKKLK